MKKAPTISGTKAARLVQLGMSASDATKVTEADFESTLHRLQTQQLQEEENRLARAVGRQPRRIVYKPDPVPTDNNGVGAGFYTRYQPVAVPPENLITPTNTRRNKS